MQYPHPHHHPPWRWHRTWPRSDPARTIGGLELFKRHMKYPLGLAIAVHTTCGYELKNVAASPHHQTWMSINYLWALRAWGPLSWGPSRSAPSRSSLRQKPSSTAWTVPRWLWFLPCVFPPPEIKRHNNCIVSKAISWFPGLQKKKLEDVGYLNLFLFPLLFLAVSPLFVEQNDLCQTVLCSRSHRKDHAHSYCLLSLYN